MFFCEKCRVANRWPMSMFKSKGRCEICNHLAACNDIPSSRLPEGKAINGQDVVQSQGESR